jgi:hypothetical protein
MKIFSNHLKLNINNFLQRVMEKVGTLLKIKNYILYLHCCYAASNECVTTLKTYLLATVETPVVIGRESGATRRFHVANFTIIIL